ncbi:MAG: adaptor protein MecA [Clostridia bacterium]|nr:adaptor protein MecA [Clostridia bacterium]
MHIIKISPVSFKIILSKEDLMRHGVENILNHADISGDFFGEIIEQTNRLYGNPFVEGAIDAEFFESKDGGGELFLVSSKKSIKSTTYLFRTESSDALISLCRRLSEQSTIAESRLFFDEGKYSLILLCQKGDDFLVSLMKEYGTVSEISLLQRWLLEEHARLIIDKEATRRITEAF